MGIESTKFLVVDDFSTMRRIVRNLLKELGFADVQEAEDGVDALAKLRAGDFEFVVSDWNMPNMTGIELLKTVRGNPSTAKLRFILLTGHSEKDQVLEAAKSGVTAYVTKPLSETILIQKVLEVLSA